MKNNTLAIILVAVVLIGGIAYYQQHTHTAKIDLPGNNDVKITTHD